LNTCEMRGPLVERRAHLIECHWRPRNSLVIIPVTQSPKGEHEMSALAWYELIVLWGFAVLVMILDQKNWSK